MVFSRINHNVSAVNSTRNLNNASAALSKSLERLSSGLRVNRASDDAAGLFISEKLRSQINGLNQAIRNSQDGISLIQTAEGAMEEDHSILQRLRVLAVQAANDTNTQEDRNAIQKEVDALITEIQRISDTAEFNTRKLLDGSSGLNITTLSSVLNPTGTTQTQAGTLTVRNTATGTAAMTAATYASRTQIGSAIGTVTTASTITINGTMFSFQSGQTTAAVVDAINNAQGSTGVVATLTPLGMIQLDQVVAGSNYQIDITSPTGNFSAVLTAGTTFGADANLVSSAGSTTVTSFRSSGNQVEILNGTMKGLKFQVSATTGAGPVDLLRINSNNALSFHVGPNAGQTIDVSLGSLSSMTLGIDSVDMATRIGAEGAMTVIDRAISMVSDQRGALGAIQNRLEHTVANLSVNMENLTASESRIRDTDVAAESTIFTRNQILVQAGTAILGQANMAPSAYLSLLQQ